MSASCDVSVIVVNWNAGDRLRACAQSLAEGARGVHAELIVVDNASVDGSLDAIESAAAPLRVDVIRRSENTGFAAACNVGLDRAAGRHALLLNPDARLAPGALDVIVGWLDRRPDVGALGPRVVDEAGAPEATVGRFPTLRGMVRRVLGRARPPAPPDGDAEPVEVDWVSGACLALGGSARAAGIRLDPGYPLYVEDVDLCRRVWAVGLRVAFLPETLVVHARGGAGAGAVDARARRRLRRYGEARFHRRWGGAGGRFLAVGYALLVRAGGARPPRLPDAPRRV